MIRKELLKKLIDYILVRDQMLYDTSSDVYEEYISSVINTYGNGELEDLHLKFFNNKIQVKDN